MNDRRSPDGLKKAGPVVAMTLGLAQIRDHGGDSMMHWHNFLMEEMGEAASMSRSALALCCAIIEDAEVAREFEIEPRGAMDLLRAVMLGATHVPRDLAPTPRELTSLVA
jgi:hypothetical protein